MPLHQPKITSLLEGTEAIGLSKAKFYVIYSDTDHNHFHTRYLKDGYKHVCVIKFTGYFWIKMDFGTGWMDFDVLLFDQYDNIKTVLQGQDVTYQYIETWREPRYRVRGPFAPCTCVEAVKALLGIRAPFVLTPYQLHKYLEKYHG